MCSYQNETIYKISYKFVLKRFQFYHPGSIVMAIKYLIVCLMIINPILLSTLYSQEGPKAALSGPKESKVNQAVIVRTNGSVGDDFKFKITPSGDYVQNFVFRDLLSGDLIFLFTTSKAGQYTVGLSAGKAVKEGEKTVGKTDIDLLTIIISDGVGPVPPPLPKPEPSPKPEPIPIPQSELTKLLQVAYTTDIGAGVGTANQRLHLSSLYKNSANITVFDVNRKRPSDVYSTMRDVIKALKNEDGSPKIPDGSLPSLRQAIASYQKNNFKITDTPFSVVADPKLDPVRQQMSLMFRQIHESLEQLREPDRD